MKLNRSFNQRKALIRTQLNSFVKVGRIETTLAKGKMLKPLIDRLITRAKMNSVHTRRLLAANLANTDSVTRLVDVIAPVFADLKSGFTTLSKVKVRRGDGVTLVALKLTRDLPAPVTKEKIKSQTLPDKKPAKQTMLNAK